jgi:KTSC domain
MTRNPITSSLIKSAGFEDGILELEFANGTLYRYQNVTQEQYDGFLASDSKGKYLNATIKPSCPCTKVAPESAA